MTSAYLNIRNIVSLQTVLDSFKNINNKNDIIAFFDWDDNIINPDDDHIIEPEVTKKLFDYMLKNKIFFSIITGRFQNTVCDDTKIDLKIMYNNIIETIYPTLIKLGLNVSEYLTPQSKDKYDKIRNDKGECVGILYMGIFFSGKKGETIKNYIKQTSINKKYIFFIDDYEPYLMETTKSFPAIIAFRRMVPYTASYNN